MHVIVLLCLNLKIKYCLALMVVVGFVLEVQVCYNLLGFGEPLRYGHDIIGVHSPPYNFRSCPKFSSPCNNKAPGAPLIYLVGLLAISDPHINIYVGPPNTCVALKQFNLFTP